MGCFPYECVSCGGGYRRCGGEEHSDSCEGGQFCYETQVVIEVSYLKPKSEENEWPEVEREEILLGNYDCYGRVKVPGRTQVYIPSEFLEYLPHWKEDFDPSKMSVSIWCKSCYQSQPQVKYQAEDEEKEPGRLERPKHVLDMLLGADFDQLPIESAFRWQVKKRRQETPVKEKHFSPTSLKTACITNILLRDAQIPSTALNQLPTDLLDTIQQKKGDRAFLLSLAQRKLKGFRKTPEPGSVSKEELDMVDHLLHLAREVQKGLAKGNNKNNTERYWLVKIMELEQALYLLRSRHEKKKLEGITWNYWRNHSQQEELTL